MSSHSQSRSQRGHREKQSFLSKISSSPQQSEAYSPNSRTSSEVFMSPLFSQQYQSPVGDRPRPTRQARFQTYRVWCPSHPRGLNSEFSVQFRSTSLVELEGSCPPALRKNLSSMRSLRDVTHFCGQFVPNRSSRSNSCDKKHCFQRPLTISSSGIGDAAAEQRGHSCQRQCRL